MNWKTEAIDKLHRYDAMCQAVQNIPKELQRLELAASSIRGAQTDGTPVKGSGGRREEALLDNLVYRQELESCLEQAKLWLSAVDGALAVLEPEDRLILSKMLIYPERNGVQSLCGMLRCEQSSVYRKRDKALHRFTVALYGAPDS